MKIDRDEPRLQPIEEGTATDSGLEHPSASPGEVRSIERQFLLMEQAHDRIRSEELAARLRERAVT